MKYSVEIGFNGIITQSLEGISFPNQTISISTEYSGTKIGCGLSNNIKQIAKDFNVEHCGDLCNRNIYKILRETINEWLLKLEMEVMLEDVENTNEEKKADKKMEAEEWEF